MEFDVFTLSWLQFACTVMFHDIFSPLSSGIGGLMVGGALLGMTIVLTYTGIMYWTFRGKLRPGEFCH